MPVHYVAFVQMRQAAVLYVTVGDRVWFPGCWPDLARHGSNNCVIVLDSNTFLRFTELVWCIGTNTFLVTLVGSMAPGKIN